MIGLGSNRLTVCRRGGMSVTQAGRGGMEWLAGFRVPSWSSPYSAQATAALKAQFPTQWPTIKAYGFAHPEIVPYVNAYCPTYPFAVLEFTQTGRCIIKTDRNAYFKTGYTPNNNTRAEVEFYYLQDSQAVFGSRVAYQNNALFIGSGNNSGTINLRYDYWNVEAYTAPAYNEFHEMIVDLYEKKAYCDGVLVANLTQGSFTSAKELYIGAINNNGSASYWGNSQYTQNVHAKIYEAGVLKHWFIPVENNKILDAATGNVINKSGSGTATFAIEWR